MALVVTWTLLFIVVPTLMIAVVSVLQRDARTFVTPAFSLESYMALADPVYLKIFGKSFAYAAMTTLLCLLVGFPFAFFLARTRKRWQKPLLLLVIIPFWTSSLIRTYALIIILKANGIINTWLRAAGIIKLPLEILYTDIAVYIGLVYTLLPFMILPLYASLEKLDFRLVEAAFDLGARPVQVFTRIILPLSLPGIMAGAIMVFLPAMGLFYVPDLLGGAKSMLLGNLIKNQFLVAGNWPFGSAVSVFLTMLMLGLMAIYFKTMKRINTSVMEEA
ncbi:MAG TPA: spermidine/putrescine ABC transporter permease [Desulfobacteraceae bacterium]|nr:spermidine/putrescine ABC transporter permease [Desulfobacteraceae bacterium]